MVNRTKKERRGRPTLHGGYSLLTTGRLPERRRYLREYLSQVRGGLIKDLGPTEADLTTAQLVLIDRIITKLGIIRCIEEYAREKGIFKGEGELSPSLSANYLAYDNAIRLGLQALGIQRRDIEGGPSALETYLASQAKEAAEKKGEDEIKEEKDDKQ
jgi:hypothetical protein